MAQMKFFRPPAPQKDLHYRCFDSEKAHPHNPTFSGHGCLTRAGESKGGMSFKVIRFRILLKVKRNGAKAQGERDFFVPVTDRFAFNNF